jgi:multiple sugar transport system permease protein
MGQRVAKKRTPLFLQIPKEIMIWSLVGFVLIYLIYSSLHKFVPGGRPVFVGIENIGYMLKDKRFHEALSRTLYYTGLGTIIEVVLGMGIALALVNATKKETLRFAILLLLLIPMTFAEAVSGNIWLLLVTPQGYINSMLRSFNLQPISWLGEQLALNTILLIDVWQWASLPLLLIYAARSSIPSELYELANLERLSTWKIFRVVTWPRIKFAVIVSTLLRFIFMNVYIDKIYVLTWGGPGRATETLGFYIFLQAFQYRNTGYAAAMSIFVLIIITVITYFFLKLMRGKE